VRAAILSIGDELVEGQTPESNARWLAQQLASRALFVIEARIVGDDRESIAAAMQDLAGRCELLVITGGLGPTDDDLTRLALGDVVASGKPLVTDPEQLRRLERRFSRLGLSMAESNLRQVEHPEGTRMLSNPLGTAPGIAARHGACRLFCLPGPPAEMEPMYRDEVEAALPAAPDTVRQTSQVHAYGLPEAAAGERLGHLMQRGRRPRVGITVNASILTARIDAVGAPRQASDQIAETRRLIEQRWAPYVYGADGESIAAAVGAILKDSGRTLATAESCTGGLLGRMIVDVNGSSVYYVGGWITYTNALKTSCLGVDETVLAEHGAVSEPVARAMAEGAAQHSGADEALGITGIAGPAGGSDDKPVGTVYIALARRDGATAVRHFRFSGNRSDVRDRAANSALQMLRFGLLDVDPEVPLPWEQRDR
jgi:nicotinamide-nucleotide amidase